MLWTLQLRILRLRADRYGRGIVARQEFVDLIDAIGNRKNLRLQQKVAFYGKNYI